MFTRTTKSNVPPAPTKFKGKERSDNSFWRRHAHATPTSPSTLPLPSSFRTTSDDANNISLSWPSAQKSQGDTTTSYFDVNTPHNRQSTVSGSVPKRGSSSNARSYADPYQTLDATGRRKLHKFHQKISRAVEDDLVTTSIRLPGLSSSGKFVRFAAEKLKRKADQIKDYVTPRALSRGPKLNWMEIQKIRRKLEDEEAENEGKAIDNDIATCVPNITEEQIRQAFQRSYNVPQVIVPGAQKGKEKAESNVNGGDTDTDTDTDGNTDTEDDDEDKENSRNQGGSTSLGEDRPVHCEGPIASSSSMLPEPMTPLSTPGSSNGIQAWIQMRPSSPSASLENRPVRPTIPDGPPASDAKTSAPVATMSGDVSTPTNQFKGEMSAFQPQQAVASSLPPFSNPPTVQHQNTTVPSSCGLSTVEQTTFQTLQAIADSQTSFHTASQSGDPAQRLFGGNVQPTAHQPTLPLTPTSQQPQPQCILPTTSVLLDEQVQQQSLFPGANVDSISHPQHQPQFSSCNANNRFTSRQETPFPFPAATALNTVFEPIGSGFTSGSFLSSGFQSQCSYAESAVFPAHSTSFLPAVAQGPYATSIQYSSQIIRRLPVLAEDPPNRPILFGPHGIHAFIKEKPIPSCEQTPIDPSVIEIKFDDAAWKASRKRRFEELEERQRIKPGPLNITNLPPLPKKTYSGQPPKGSEEDLIRRLEIERKDNAKRAKRAKKGGKRVRFLLPGKELEGPPVRKRRRTEENLAIIAEKPAPPSSQSVGLNTLPLETKADPVPVMPGAYEMLLDVGNADKSIKICPMVDHIFTFLWEQLGAYGDLDNDRVEEDYPV